MWRARWLERRQETRGQRLALLPLELPAALYGLGAVLHRAMYRCGLRRARRFPGRVVSVGNLTVGGNAKTVIGPSSAMISGCRT